MFLWHNLHDKTTLMPWRCHLSPSRASSSLWDVGFDQKYVPVFPSAVKQAQTYNYPTPDNLPLRVFQMQTLFSVIKKVFIRESASVITPVGNLITFLTLLNLFLSCCHIPQFYCERHTCQLAEICWQHLPQRKTKTQTHATCLHNNHKPKKKHVSHKLISKLFENQVKQE